MKTLAAMFGSLAILVMALAWAYAISQPTPYDPVAHARQEAQIARYEAEAARARALEPLDLTIAAAWRLVPLLAVLGGMGYLASLGVAHIMRFRSERMPNEDGLLPVPVTEIAAVSPQALGAFHGARQIEAARQLVPHTLTYHQTYSPRLDHRADPAGTAGTSLAELPAPTSLAVVVPTFRQLLEGGRVGRGPDGRANPLILGYDRGTGSEIAGTWLDLYSCAVGGLSGTGKSWTATYLLAQAALHGARLIILDPHADNSESLASRLAPLAQSFVCAPADTPKAMMAAIELAQSELASRTAPGANYQRSSAPIVLVADEFASLQRGELAHPLAAIVEALAQEGRKVDIFGMICSQVWTANRAGGTTLRDSLASAYVHRLRPAQARYLTGIAAADLPDDLLELPPGVCYLLSTTGELRPITIPRMAPEDLHTVAKLISPAATNVATNRQPLGFRPATKNAPDGSQKVATSEWLPTASASPEAARAAALFLAGKSPAEIVKELRGITSNAGGAYQRALAEILDLIREGLQ